jgi:hypothetical protein
MGGLDKVRGDARALNQKTAGKKMYGKKIIRIIFLPYIFLPAMASE